MNTSLVLDFSSEFRLDPRERNKQTGNLTRSLGEIIDESNHKDQQTGDKENMSNNAANGHGSSRFPSVSKQISAIAHGLELSVDTDQIPLPVLECFAKLMQESERTRSHSQQLSDDSQSVRMRNDQLEKENEKLKNQINNLYQVSCFLQCYFYDN